MWPATNKYIRSKYPGDRKRPLNSDSNYIFLSWLIRRLTQHLRSLQQCTMGVIFLKTCSLELFFREQIEVSTVLWCWWRIFWMLVKTKIKIHVFFGELCWWKIPTYNFIHIHQHDISPLYFSLTSRRSRSSMLMKVLNQHTGFSPTYIFHWHLSSILKLPSTLIQSQL